MAETGVIAYSKNSSDNIKIFWDSFIGLKDDKGNLLITTIYNKLLPLINYRTDDIVKSFDNLSILTIEQIMGRKKDILKVKLQNEILELSGILMIHLLKSYQGIMDIQFEQLNNGKIKILFSSYEALDKEKISKYFIKNIRIDHKNVTKESFQFIQVENIEKTIAGKSKWIK
jgi:phenylacetate-coenzyme A ligase PaaK-like adenylate-forming protein